MRKRWKANAGPSLVERQVADTLLTRPMCRSACPSSRRTPGSPTSHTHERHENLYVSKGSVEPSVGQETRTANTGDFTILEPYERHRPAAGETKLCCLSIPEIGKRGRSDNWDAAERDQRLDRAHARDAGPQRKRLIPVAAAVCDPSPVVVRYERPWGVAKR